MSTRTTAIIDIIWAVLLVILAVKWLPVVGIFGMLTVLLAALKIGSYGVKELNT